MNTRKYGHYTSQLGLMGIVTQKKLWATNINFLNDAHEFLHAIQLIKDLIKESSKNFPTDRSGYSTYRSFIEKVEDELSKLEKNVSETIFTMSFSEKTDLLSQWRGYCPANNGFCLVFNLDEIFQAIKSKYPNSYLKDCVYKNADKQKELRTILNTHWHRYSAKHSPREKVKVLNDLSKAIMLLASYFKHPSFSEEAERRIIINLENSKDSNLKFREGKFTLIPYLELDIPIGDLKKVYLGPTANTELAKRAAQMFLKNNLSNSKVLTITVSKTPYRPW
jgi:hypothetical protein